MENENNKPEFKDPNAHLSSTTKSTQVDEKKEVTPDKVEYKDPNAHLSDISGNNQEEVKHLGNLPVENIEEGEPSLEEEKSEEGSEEKE
jgi:hypothetical protein